MKLFQKPVLKKKLFKVFFLFLALAAILFSEVERFEHKKNSGEIISKTFHRFSRSRLKFFTIYSPDGHFAQRSGTV